jgi:Spy/CpxP family protein refolding chaperone
LDKETLMKRLTITLAAIAFAAAQAVLAQPPAGGSPPGGSPLERLTQELNLNDAQKAQVKQIFDEERAKRDAARAQLGPNATPDARRAKMQEIQQDMMQKLGGVLTPAQMEKFKEMQQERRQQGAPPPSGH